MNPPLRMDEEDRRAIHILAANEGYLELGTWLSQDLVREKPDEDLHGMLRHEMMVAGASKTMISWMTLTHLRDYSSRGSPNSAGRYVLGLSDQELVDGVNFPGLTLPHYLRGSPAFPGLIEFLFEAAPERLDVIAPVVLEPRRLHRQICELMLERGGGRFAGLIGASCAGSRSHGPGSDLPRCSWRTIGPGLGPRHSISVDRYQADWYPPWEFSLCNG